MHYYYTAVSDVDLHDVHHQHILRRPLSRRMRSRTFPSVTTQISRSGIISRKASSKSSPLSRSSPWRNPPSRSRSPMIPDRELDDHITGGKLKLRFQNDPALFQKTVHKLSGTRIFFQEDTGQHAASSPVLHPLSLQRPELVSGHKGIPVSGCTAKAFTSSRSRVTRRCSPRRNRCCPSCRDSMRLRRRTRLMTVTLIFG